MVLRDLLRSLRFHITLSRLPLDYTYALRMDYPTRVSLLPCTNEAEVDVWMDMVSRGHAIVSCQKWVRGKWPWNWSLHSLYIRECKNQPLLSL